MLKHKSNMSMWKRASCKARDDVCFLAALLEKHEATLEAEADSSLMVSECYSRKGTFAPL